MGKNSKPSSKSVTTVSRSELSTIKMAAGNEKRFGTVIMDGIVQEWAGIGWISNGVPATKRDYKNYPEVID